MVEPQSSRFWQATIRSGLLDAAALQKSWDQILPEKRTADAIDRRLARQLVSGGVLTLWQAQQILAGRWQGLRIDKYALRDVIGHGGMGRVYLAQDTRLGRYVAVKILSRERMNNSRAMARFRREAKVGAQLQHENLVRIYDEGEAHGVRYLVMEYIEGKTVGHLVAEMTRIPYPTAADIARQVALGLEHLHQKGLLHRDVNPMNILVDRSGTSKLTDLGLAIDLADQDDVVTRDGATVGTFDYISPEQAKHSRLADGRSDIYSLGCSLYHMLAGRVPFPTASLPEKLYAHQATEPDSLISQVEGLPEGLETIVFKMMMKNPADRYASPLEVARALEPFSRGGSFPSRFAGEPVANWSAGSAGEANGKAPVPSGDTPTGSDPDLELQGGPSPNPPPSVPQTATSKSMDFFPRIDLGPEPSLSEIRSKPRTIAKRKPVTSELPTWVGKDWKKFGIAGAAILVIALVLAGLVFLVLKAPWSASIAERKPVGPVKATAEPNPNPSVTSRPDIALVDPDGQEVAQGSLSEAIQSALGRNVEIVVRTNKPQRSSDISKSFSFTTGSLVIRAADGARPEILVDLSNKAPWIQVGTQAKLSLIGLRVQAEVILVHDQNKTLPTLIESAGNVSIDRCHFLTTSADRTASVLTASGLDTRIAGTVFEGFDRPITLDVFPGANAQLSQCLFVRAAGADPLAGWALAITGRKTIGQTKSRKLSLDRCTVLGAGLLVANGFTPAAPLEVSVKNSALKLGSLLMTSAPKADLPKALHWAGKENWYVIPDPKWVVVPPKGFDALAGSPVDLKSWADLMGNDTAGRDDVLTFSGGPMPGEGKPPEDFAIPVEKDKPAIGIDPKKVGPEAKAEKK